MQNLSLLKEVGKQKKLVANMIATQNHPALQGKQN
jgi:3-deoxy-D-arabino-heptulosonate 7-phosphate (DAHP) synthase